MNELVEKPAISVIMLTYNREELVGRAVESILNQTFRKFEFIIIDNGSSDQSGKICDAYAARDNRVQVIHQEPESIGHGRNTGLDIAQGEYITFIDDDDYAEPDFLEFLYKLIIKNNADLAICGCEGKVFDEKLIMDAEQALIELMWRKRYTMAFPTKLFHSKLIENLRFPPDSKYDDIALMYKLLANTQRVAYHGLSKYTFVRHENNNSAWTTDHSLLTGETLDEYLQSYRSRTDWLSTRFPKSANIFKYFEWSFLISMVEKINRYHITDCTEQLSNMRKKLMIHREEFLGSKYILDFEREWMEEYV